MVLGVAAMIESTTVDFCPLSATIKQTVKLTGISRATLYRQAHKGHFRMMKVGSRTLIDMSSMAAYLQSRPSPVFQQKTY